ncbi:AAA family ATPase [Bifidobacterium vespertilionis]|uniref:AAA family ATPase n=1 Tax=Bifidobacterium vespertilionis TaxID=2562524 RepID=UPI001BDBB5EE|nr:ATP-binding protein [Bifidobacterium vespertilionis]MBT1180101.1 ATP-binding protein [Bifidobacterium vespertilionis]
MLVDFSFSNFRSFEGEQAFSMTRDARFSDGSFDALSTIAAVYGPNASGKSNFLKALWAMVTMVCISYSQGDAKTGVPRDPFRLNKKGASEPSSFFIEFLAGDGQRYRYWFRFDDDRILYEELDVFKRLGDRLSSHSAKLFSRDPSGISFGGTFRGPRAQVRKTIELRPNALVLSAAAAAGIECTQPAFDFFAGGIAYCDAQGYLSEQARILNEFKRKTEFSRHLATLIRYADFGIDAVRSTPAIVDKETRTRLKKQLQQQIGADPEKIDQIFSQEESSTLQFEHVGDGNSAMFDEHSESKGTIAAMSFFSLALRQLSHPTITLIDEIDTSLHPSLVEEFVRLFTDPLTNPHASQLIFTTHDTSLINASGPADRLIDADQIWLVEKSRTGASELYPVTDLKVRKEENIGRNYLNGIYGAVPKPDFHTAFAKIIGEDNRA